MHWRLASNSPLTGYSQGRIMGGGSSVMGMVALRGTPDDYDEWEESGATGWGWNDVLPFFLKLEHDVNFSGDLHGADGPVPIRRTPRRTYGRRCPTRWRVSRVSGNTLRRRHERRLPRRLCLGADQQLAEQARFGRDLLSCRADVRARTNLSIVTSAMVETIEFDGRRATGVNVNIGGEHRQFHGSEIIVSLGGIHSPAMLHALRYRPGGACCASTASRCAPTCPASAATCRNHSLLFLGMHLPPRGAAIAGSEDACQHGAAFFLRRARLSAHRHVHQRAEQDVMERARPAHRQSRAVLWKPIGRGRVALRSA